MDDRLTYAEAAALLDPEGKEGVTVRTIRRLVADGALQKVKIGRHPTVFRKQILALILEGGPCRRSTSPGRAGENGSSPHGTQSPGSVTTFSANATGHGPPPKTGGKPPN